MITDDFVVSHVRVETDRPFADVIRDFEHRLGRFDPAVSGALASGSADTEAVRARIEAMAGSSGLMSFGTFDHGALLSLVGKPRRAVQYLVGNPLIALEMTQHALGAALYAPLRVLIAEAEAGRTCVEYDVPSSLFGRFGDGRITQIARTLDRKLGELVASAAGVNVDVDVEP
jgi:uncharacterized protein (DUF302 family)